MAIRTTRSVVTFTAPFRLPDMDEPHPPGTFNVDTDEEVIEGIERNAYVRVATLLYLHDGSRGRLLTVDPAILQQALDRDASGTAAPGDEACAQ